MAPDWDVVVVGGGVAGLAAAGRLTQAGRRVALLEARSRLGGRIHTVIDPATGHPVELGAEFIQGRIPELDQIIQAGGLILQRMPERHERGEEEAKEELPPVEDLVDRLLQLTGPDVGDIPVARLIRERARTRFDADDLVVLTRFLESFHAADLERFGTEALAENQAAETRDGWGLFRLAGGYRELVSQLESRLDPSLVQMRTDTVVSQVRWTPGHVEIEARSAIDNTAEVLTGPQAILTLPLGILKTTDGAGTVLLEPSPPGWKEALEALEMGIAERIDLRFDGPWWISRSRAVAGFVHGSDEPFPVWWTTSPPESPFLTGWTGGPRALALAGLSHDEVVRLALESVSKVFGVQLSTLEASLRASYRHDWTTDPFARGAYSYGGVGARAARKALLRPVADTLFLAGEAVAEGGRNATVAGALISGLRSAEALLGTPMTTHSR
jgi:monoamine oxidase